MSGVCDLKKVVLDYWQHLRVTRKAWVRPFDLCFFVFGMALVRRSSDRCVEWDLFTSNRKTLISYNALWFAEHVFKAVPSVTEITSLLFGYHRLGGIVIIFCCLSTFLQVKGPRVAMVIVPIGILQCTSLSLVIDPVHFWRRKLDLQK